MKLLLLAILLTAANAFAQDGGTSAPAAPGFDLGSAFDSAVGDTEVPEGDAPAAGEAQEAEENEGTDPVEGEPEGEAEPEAEGVDDWDDDQIGAPTIIEGADGKKLYQWPEAAAREIQQRVKFANELQTAIPDLTVDDAVVLGEAYTDLMRFSHDMRTGTPDALRRVAQTLLNEAGSNSASVATLTSTLVGHLRNQNPQAYQKISGTVEADLESELYRSAQEAQQMPDTPENKNIKEGYRVLAEMFAFHRNGGKFTPLGEFAKNAATNPIDERIQRAEAIERQHQERVANESRQATETWETATNNHTNAETRKTVEGMLPERFKKDATLKPMVVNHVLGQVRARLKADTEFAQRFEIQYDQARTERSRQSAQRIADSYLARAKGILKRELPKMITSASNDVVDQSRQRHKSLAAASGPQHQRPGATGNTKQSIARKPQAFKTQQEYEKHISELLS